MNKSPKHFTFVSWQPALCAAALFLAATRPAAAQNTGASALSADPTQSPPLMGPHSRTWQGGKGHRIVELATGMNYWDGQQWTPSDTSFEIAQNGDVVEAAKVQHKIRLKANLNQIGAVTLLTDGITLNTTPVGICLYDAASGAFATIGTITNCQGILVESNKVVYADAFNGVCGDVVYTLEKGSFHQDVVLTGRLDPADYGFPPSTTRIQILTEFYQAPQPERIATPLHVEKNQTVRNSMASPDLIDEELGFGGLVFGHGRAFTAASANDFHKGGTLVAKQYQTIAGRTFLFESVEYPSIAEELQSLPDCNPPGGGSHGAKLDLRKSKVGLAAMPAPTPDGRATVAFKRAPTQVAKLAADKPPGFIIDYVALVGTLSGTTVFQGDTTYFISGALICSGAVKIESAVFKFPTNTASIEINSTCTLATASYRPAIFTAADDNTVGETLGTNVWSGYTGNPTGKYYANPALRVRYSGAGLALNNCRFSYAQTAVSYLVNPGSQTISNSQFVQCLQGVTISSLTGVTPVTFNNCLMSHVQTPFTSGAIGATFNQCTVADSAQLLNDLTSPPQQQPPDPTNSESFSSSFMSASSSMSGGLPPDGIVINSTNSVFSNITNLYATTNLTAAPTFSGAFNGFYNTSTFGGSFVVSPVPPFQTAGAGNYYLAITNIFHGTGTTNIDATLLASLKQKTTYPPLILTNAITADTTLVPQALRNTGAPDLGYSYDPIDFLVSCTVSNATLTLSNGVALAYYKDPGLGLDNNSHLVSQGAPNQKNYLVHYNLVQEQPVNLWGISNAVSLSLPIDCNHANAAQNPTLSLRFTTLCAPSGANLVLDTADGRDLASLSLQDCEIYCAGAQWSMGGSSTLPVFSFKNNLFHRPLLGVYCDALVITHNNLFTGGSNNYALFLNGGYPYNWTNTDNAFDGVETYLDGTISHNAYLNGAPLDFTPAGSDITTNITWVTGPVGNYYQATNSPIMANSPLINMGSVANAALAGLYHYTTTTNQVKEFNTILDIGYHYVALNRRFTSKL